LNFFK
jgi:hypothetical protein